MLTRIYGVAFGSKQELDEYLIKLEEAKKRDHRKLGKELDLFHIDDQVGLGLPLWHPKGARLWRIIEDFWYQEHLKNGYGSSVVHTSAIAVFGKLPAIGAFTTPVCIPQWKPVSPWKNVNKARKRPALKSTCSSR